MEAITTSKIVKNVFIVIAVQAISAIVSFVVGFIVPKFITEIAYSRWQVYFLYANYSALFHFGIYDGFVIRYSKKDYDELDKKIIRPQFFLLNILLDFISLIVLSVVFIIRRENFLMIALICGGIISKNLFRYFSYLFHASNDIHHYSLANLIERIAYVVGIVALLFARSNNFYLFCLCDIAGCVIGSIYGIIVRPALFFGNWSHFRETISEIKKNFTVGVFVTISTFCFSFLVIGAKLFVQWNWDELTFGQISFSISVMNVFLTFITAASVVMLPSMRRISRDDLPLFYSKVRKTILLILFFGLTFFFPARILLKEWIPNYSSGLFYVGLILPAVIFNCKISIVTNNYLKYFEKEKMLFFINVGTMLLGLILFAVFALAFQNLELLLYSVNIVCLINSLISEIIVCKTIKIKLGFDIVAEIIVAIIFLICSRFLPDWISFCAFLVVVLLFFVFNRVTIKEMLAFVKKKWTKAKES